MTTTQPKPTTTAEIGGIGHSVKRVEDDRFVAGQGFLTSATICVEGGA